MTTPTHALIKAQHRTPYGNHWKVRCQTCRESMDDYDDRFGARVWIQWHVGGIGRQESDRLFLAADWWPEVQR